MMEYSIGSVADLISGSVTPNKPKVVKKQFTPKTKTPPSVKMQRESTSPDKNQKALKRKRSISPKTKKLKTNGNFKLSSSNKKQKEVIPQVKEPLKKRTKKQSASPKAKQHKHVVELPSITDSDTDNNEESDTETNAKQNIYASSNDEESDTETNTRQDINASSNDEESDDEFDAKQETNDSSDVVESEDESDVKNEAMESSNNDEESEDNDDEESEDDSDLKQETNKPSDDEESDDESDAKVQIKAKKGTKSENSDRTTIFVGNLPISVTHNKLKKLFSKFGKVENARIRSVPVADPKVPKKVAAIKKQFHPDRKSLHGYVSFINREDAIKALAFNGKEYKDHHIRVNMCDNDQKPDRSKAIFLGNVSFAAEEEELWKLFQSCGEIESVRLIRDRRTDIGKGFGYINFKSSDSVELALQMGDVKLRDRVLRISLYNGKAPKKANAQKPSGEQKKHSNLEKGGTNGQFQGKTASQKKKKFHKGNQQKKKLAKKIAPKSKSE